MELPVRPVKGQLLHLRSMDGKPPVRHNLRGLDIYIVPRPDGRMVVGATVEEQAFDVTVTAGAALELLRAAYELLPGVTEMELTEIASGLRPGSPDNAPMIGPARPDGLIVATGHFRNGVLLTPVTADSVIAMIETGDVPAEVAGFSPHRFDAGG
jgi:glycine oxidase